MCHFQIRGTYRFQIRKINLFQIRKGVVFKYEKRGLYVFSNTNVTFFCVKRHAIIKKEWKHIINLSEAVVSRKVF